jgi:AcrR family transcriptional regulator
MSIRDRPRRDVERNHEAILTAAIAVLADSPRATMVDIAHASGTGRSTLYRHFPDRKALTAAIYERIRVEAAEIVARWLPREAGDTAEDPVALIAGLCSALAGIGDRYRFLEHHQTELAAKHPDRTRQIAEVFMAYLTRHQQTGQIRTDLPTEWLLAVLAAVIKAAAKHDLDAERSAVIHRTVRSLLTPPAN